MLGAADACVLRATGDRRGAATAFAARPRCRAAALRCKKSPESCHERPHALLLLLLPGVPVVRCALHPRNGEHSNRSQPARARTGAVASAWLSRCAEPPPPLPPSSSRGCCERVLCVFEYGKRREARDRNESIIGVDRHAGSVGMQEGGREGGRGKRRRGGGWMDGGGVPCAVCNAWSMHNDRWRHVLHSTPVSGKGV